MITINLLPAELRRRSGPPVKVLAMYAAVTTVLSTLGAVWVWLAFGVAAEVDARKAQLSLEMDGIRPRLQYHKALESEIQVAAAREAKLTGINKERVVWTEKVDQLIDVVNSGNEVDHFIWFDDMNVRPGQRVRGNQATGGTLSLSGHSGSGADPRSGLEKTAKFLKAIADTESSDFMREFHGLERDGVIRSVRQSEPDEELIPSVHWSFPLTLQLRDAEERWEVRKAAADQEESR